MKRKLTIGGVIVFILIWVGVYVGLQTYDQRIYPGVSVGRINIGGKTTNEAIRELGRNQLIRERVTIEWRGLKWTIPTVDLGLEYSPQLTVVSAMKVGRQGNILNQIKEIYITSIEGQLITMAYHLDESKFNAEINKIAEQINIPASEPEIKIDEVLGKIVVTPGENGQVLDKPLLMMRIKQVLSGNEDTPVEAPIIYLKPKLSSEQVEIVRNKSEFLIGKTVKMKFETEKKEWIIDDNLLVSWLDPQYLGWKRSEVENWVTELAKTIDRPAQNANFRFITEGKVEEFKPAMLGFRVLQNETTDTLIGALIALEKGNPSLEIELVNQLLLPEVETEDVNNLGIKELIGRGESWFSGSITNRIFNLARAATTMNGVLLAPGEVFSFNKIVGEISTATGYKQAYIIKDGKTILGDGGGVCQTSTTLFRAVLSAGLPVEERTAHAYRVSYYEEKYQPGFDATIFQPAPDFKFLNDTGNYVLIQTRFDEKNKHLVYELYGTSDGRKAVTSKSRMWESTPPPPDLYIDDPNLPVGKIVQTEHSAWGAKVAFDWTVTRGEETLQQRTFFSNYLPWQAVYLRGTKI